VIDRSPRLLFIIQTIAKYPGNDHRTVPRGNLFLILLLFFFLIRLESTVSPTASSRRSNRRRWRNRDRECLLPLNVPDRYDRSAGYFSNLERKSGVSKGVCMTDCANDRTLRSCFSRDARLPSAEKHGV